MKEATVVPAALQRCLNSPYLARDEGMRARSGEELAKAQGFLQQAEGSFGESDEASGLKQVWGAMYHAARALAYRAGYRVEQLRCLEVALLASYPTLSNTEMGELRRAQELLGPPDAALARGRRFLEQATALLR